MRAGETMASFIIAYVFHTITWTHLHEGRQFRLLMMNDYRRGWALRYLREAKAELAAAQKTPYMAPSLVFEALRKAQAAIYYSLGEPTFIAAIVHETLYTKQFVEDPILRFLIEIERSIQQISQKPRSDSEIVMKQVADLVQLASEIVELLTGESVKLTG